jgi:hypothetical protein
LIVGSFASALRDAQGMLLHPMDDTVDDIGWEAMTLK